MGTPETANEDYSRLSLWLRVRRYAVPPSVIETATARRRTGDWGGACAAAGIDVDLRLRSVAHTHGRDLAARIRADLRHLAPDLLRWHMPRIAPDGLLRPGLTVTLARYEPDGGGPPVHLVVRTPPAWADAGQRMSLAVWDGGRAGSGASAGERGHPHPHPSRRFRLDLHRHLWDARRAGELGVRAGGAPSDGPGADGVSGGGGRVPGGADRVSGGGGRLTRAFGEGPGAGPGRPPVGCDGGLPEAPGALGGALGVDLASVGGRTGINWSSWSGSWLPDAFADGLAVERWADEALLVLRDRGRVAGPVLVRLGAGRRLVLDVGPAGQFVDAVPWASYRGHSALPVLPDAAVRVLPDLELLRAGLLDAGDLHPLVAEALLPGHRAPATRREPDAPGGPRIVDCRGARHRIGLVDGVLSALDHTPEEIRREDLLVALGGPPLPCLQAIDDAHRRPDCLTGVRERLDHGDLTGALAVVEGLLGPDAVLRGGALRDELETAAQRLVAYGLFRAGLADPPGPVPHADPRRTGARRSGSGKQARSRSLSRVRHAHHAQRVNR
ncbi:hypothetical protein [Streptomyces griseosporeus]|uniref:hypothetical protein n=1 Tax=Streptomyces griseosporeus TaxID=1910 RepID=UPI00167CBF9F|nr:hypothetical protein [Streptomyces griseosporeus]GHF74579.1 hypothetical protein GCM10018783_50390 [Streptomyces griseosporeus]